MKYLCNFTCAIDGQKYPLYQKLDGGYNEYLETIYKDNLYDKLHVDFEFYDRVSNDLIQTIQLQVSTSIFNQMELDRWRVSVKLLEEIIDTFVIADKGYDSNEFIEFLKIKN